MGFSVGVHLSDFKELKTGFQSLRIPILERNMMDAFSPSTRRQRQAELYEFESLKLDWSA